MFELRIETASKAIKPLQEGWPTRAVSLVGDDLRFPLSSFGKHHLVLRFDDVENSGADGFVAPTSANVETVLSHCSGLSDADRLLVHCHAGRSRSPAMAIGILIANGSPPGEAFQIVKAARPALIPNRLITSQIDQHLRLNGELIDLVSKHYLELPDPRSLPDRGGWDVRDTRPD